MPLLFADACIPFANGHHAKSSHGRALTSTSNLGGIYTQAYFFHNISNGLMIDPIIWSLHGIHGCPLSVLYIAYVYSLMDLW